ncbi:hypothetical protein VPH35_081500 [Triticum aestivum]
MLDSGDLLPASRDKSVSVLVTFASSEGERAPISTRKESAHRPHAPHSGSLAPTPSQWASSSPASLRRPHPGWPRPPAASCWCWL